MCGPFIGGKKAHFLTYDEGKGPADTEAAAAATKSAEAERVRRAMGGGNVSLLNPVNSFLGIDSKLGSSA